MATVNEEDGQCECGEGAEGPDDEGICACSEGFIEATDATCVACSGIGAQLDENDECSCADDHVIVTDNVCGCDEANNWFLFALAGECRKCDSDWSDLNIDTGLCNCIVSNSILAAAGNTCECDEGYMADGASCVMCSATDDIVAAVTNGECVCEGDNVELIDGVCTCPEGFVHFEGNCVACAGADAFLDDAGVCSCPDHFVLNSENTCTFCSSGTLIENTIICDFFRRAAMSP